MLASLTVTRRPGIFTFVTIEEPVDLTAEIHAVVQESEGVTLIVTTDTALARGWEVSLQAAWLTLEVHSSLEAVGLTAAVAEALATESIPCNVVAGYFHDHLLVPIDRAEAAIRRISSLRCATK